ncbi:F-box/FBD/LRR-repeat protein-like protein, partial [Tanacetum coccineum]
MEGVDETPKASQVALEEDVISSMPDIVMNNILDRLPTQEAVRTAILSKDWRYKRKILSQLVFDENFYGFLQATKNERYYGKIISSLMHHLKGSIKKFVLCIDDKCYSVMDAEDINKWIIYLTENGLKQLTIKYLGEKPLRLTSHIFSYLELTHLELQNCELAPGTDYCGFPNLLGLNLIWVDIETYKCGEFLTRCPNLERLDFSSWNYDIYETDIAKLVNLKKLLWQLGTFKNTKIITSSRIFVAMGCLTKLSELSLFFFKCQLLEDARRSVPKSFPCLKKLNLLGIDFSSKTMVSFVVELLCASPNVLSLKIKTAFKDAFQPGSSEVDYGKMGQLQLRNVGLYSIRGSKNEECMIKSLLACSPLLKKIVITADTPEVFGDDHGD